MMIVMKFYNFFFEFIKQTERAGRLYEKNEFYMLCLAKAKSKVFE